MKYLIVLLFSSFLINSNSQIIQNDTLLFEKKITFLKVRHSTIPYDSAFLTICYLKKQDSIELKFKVPSLLYRVNTTLDDYFEIESRNKKEFIEVFV